MTQYHAVMLDETGCEFGHTFNATCREAAWAYVQDIFPESRCVQMEDDRDTAERQNAIYQRMAREIDGSDDYWEED
jgi:hypothetical protein